MDINSDSWRNSTPQEQLTKYCRYMAIAAPSFNNFPQRIDGRSQWSTKVTVNGVEYAARNFYLGQYLNDSKNDACGVALESLVYGNPQITQPTELAPPEESNVEYQPYDSQQPDAQY